MTAEDDERRSFLRELYVRADWVEYAPLFAGLFAYLIFTTLDYPLIEVFMSAVFVMLVTSLFSVAVIIKRKRRLFR